MGDKGWKKVQKFEQKLNHINAFENGMCIFI